jgi:hypothetical protein
MRSACGLSVLLIVLCASFAGCTGTRDPSIDITGARLGEATDEALTLQIALRLENPTAEALELLEFEYQVEVDGKTAYRGVRSAEMTLARQSAREIEIPAVVNLSEIEWASPTAGSLPQSAEFRVHGTLRYLLPGAIAQTLFDIGLQRPSAPVRGSGTVALRSAE